VAQILRLHVRLKRRQRVAKAREQVLLARRRLLLAIGENAGGRAAYQ
jgi:hypothetical protein